MEAKQEEEVDLCKENKQEQEEQLITDFSNMFKARGPPRKMPQLSSTKPVEATPNWLLEIPARLQLTRQQLQQRKVLDQRRWKSVVKTDQQEWMAMSAAVSIWNYLFSSKGTGELPPLTVKAAAQHLNSHNIKFESKEERERSSIVIACFDCFCKEFKVQAKIDILLKLINPGKTEKDADQGLKCLLEGLKDTSKAYALITTDQIVCPIGWEQTPLVPLDAYKKLEDIKPQNLELWIIHGTIERTAPSFLIKRWKHVKECLETSWPNYIDIQEPKKGPQRHPLATVDNQSSEGWGNSSCIIQFVRL